MTIGFERTEYSVDEGDQVEVCVVVRSGTLQRDAVVRASSIDGSAAGKPSLLRNSTHDAVHTLFFMLHL